MLSLFSFARARTLPFVDAALSQLPYVDDMPMPCPCQCVTEKVGSRVYRTYLVNDEKLPKRLFLIRTVYLP